MFQSRETISFCQLKLVNNEVYRRSPPIRNTYDCNKFHSVLTEPSIVYRRGRDSEPRVANDWVFDRPTTSNDHSLYRCLSKAMYGDEKWFPLVLKLLVKLERHGDFLPVFQTFISQTEDDNDRHFTQILNGSKNPGICELYAAASLYCTDIFIWNVNREEWTVYHPLILPTKSRRHFVTMATLTDGGFEVLVPAAVSPDCQVQRPPTRSLNDIRSELGKVAWEITASRSCCQVSRHGPHVHLRFLATDNNHCHSGSSTRRPTRQLSADANYALNLLKCTRRRFDRNYRFGITFRQCILKEIYGTEDSTDMADFPVPGDIATDEEILRVVNWLKRPVYIFCKEGISTEHEWKWKAFLPNRASTMCRYCVTLYRDPQTNIYARIIPFEGCNCSLPPPPIEVATDESKRDHIRRRRIAKDSRHNPMLEYFLDRVDHSSLTDEDIFMYPPERGDVSDIFHAQQREDMADRMIDTMQGQHSLSACLSKEIFGNSDQVELINKTLQSEIQENTDKYDFSKPLGTVPIQTKGELGLTAAATFFQKPILVLLVDEDGTSRWKEFTQIRRKRKPTSMPRLQSECLRGRTSDRYVATLLRNSYGEFYRILPKRLVCNCQMEKVEVPGRKTGSLEDRELGGAVAGIPDIWLQKREEFHRNYRIMNSAFGQVYNDINKLHTLLNAQLALYEEMINCFESRRRNTNKITVFGSATSMLGTVLMVGVNPVLGIGMSLFGALGVATRTWKEKSLSEKDLKTLIENQYLLIDLSQSVRDGITQFRDLTGRILADELGDVREELLRHVPKEYFDRILKMIPGFCMLDEIFQTLSNILARQAAKTSMALLGKVLAGVSVLVDTAMIGIALRSLHNGSKTETSEILRKNRYQLRGVKNSILKPLLR
ncbi:uncharacterized protein [Argopecten irradians]|uniref:uncharacterized protein n=1 Tax=Argopecten irradians TaxID=31199 RepID=UPI00371E4735